MSQKRYHPVFIGVSLVAMAILCLEVILTRIFSFSIWYHFAYLTISMALLGFGSSGAVLAAYPRIIEQGKYRLLVVVSLLSGVFIVAALLVFSGHPLQPVWVVSAPLKFCVALLIYYVGITLPFFFAGMAIATALSLFSEQVSYLYFWDLGGAAVGSLLSLLLINWLGAPGGVLLCAALMLCAACFFARQISKGLSLVVLLGCFVMLCIIPFVKDAIDVVPCDQKAVANLYRQPEKFKSLFSRWNAIGRVDVYTNLDKTEWSCWWCKFGISDAYTGPFPDVHTIQYDGHNGSNIYHFSGDPAELGFLDHHILKTPYLLLEKPKVLILGVGGGVDVFNAFNSGASSITAVELQPIAVKLLKGQFAEWTGNIFNRYKHINLIAGEGRNFIDKDREKYDHIQITHADTFIAVNTGVYVLMESYLYTTDAISAYFDHLTDNGLICIIMGDMIAKDRGNQYQPLNSRLAVEYLEVLKAHGIQSPERHIAVLGKWYPNGTVATSPLLKKSPFTEADMVTLRSFAREIDAFLIFDPLVEKAPDSFMESIIRAREEERKTLIAGAPYNIAPCTDSNPFFFHFIKWKNFIDVFNLKQFAFFTPVFGQAILLLLFIQSVVLACIFIILPLLTSKRTKAPLGKSLGYLLYFLSIGVGFMFIEISFIQKFVLFLGYPAYAFAITIFSLLLFSGLGSYWTGTLQKKAEDTIRSIFLVLAPLLLLYTWFLPHLFDYFIGESLSVKIIITILMQVPLGFVLGMFFPLGIKVVSRVDARMVPWAWGVNGMSSVVCTIAAIMLAMSFGFTVVSYLALILYGAGTGSLLLAVRRSQQQRRV
jgi:hypothetical protein